MAPFYKRMDTGWKLHQDDITGIQSLYGNTFFYTFARNNDHLQPQLILACIHTRVNRSQS